MNAAQPTRKLRVVSLRQTSTSAIHSRRRSMTLRNVLAQRQWLQHLDPRAHAHYPVRQLGRAADVHRHDRRTVATPRESLRAMNRARANICHGLFIVNFQFDSCLRTLDDSKSPLRMHRRIEGARINEARRVPVFLTNEIYRADSLDGKIDDRVAAMTMAKKVETAPICDQRVRIEVVHVSFAGQTCVIDREPALIEQRAQYDVELIAECRVILGRIEDRIKFALQVGQ